ncbi:MAG: hypothetical protein NZ937_00320 [Armatimonadetes bacterium]|nr:hypothetical protein [Armatimonadota bacterium]
MDVRANTLYYCKVCCCFVIHVTGFSQWLMTNLRAPNSLGENFPRRLKTTLKKFVSDYRLKPIA